MVVQCYNQTAHWVRSNVGGRVGLTAKQEKFCQEYALNGGNATEAYRAAYPNSKGKRETQHVQAAKMLNHPKLAPRIQELSTMAKAKAVEKFSITVEQRLKWLKEITEAGIGIYLDQGGNERRENLAAARAAIATMNDMLGVDDGDSDNHSQPLEIKFVVSAAKGKIETTNVEPD